MTLEEAVSLSKSYREVCRTLGVNDVGGSYRKIRSEIIKKGIDTSHFNPFARKTVQKKIPIEEILVAGSTYLTSRLKKRLIAEGLKEDVCELCGQGNIWNGMPLTLQLDHINGDSQDHRIFNLRILCPNCHTQTENYCSKNIRRVKPTAGDGTGFEPRRVQ